MKLPQSPLSTGSISLVLLAYLVSVTSAKENQTEILESIKKFDTCIVQASYSLLFRSTSPPTSLEAHKKVCKIQSEAFKCIKDKSKGVSSIIRRGMVAYVAARQRHHKKYCTNPDGELAKKFVADLKCIVETNLESRTKIESELALKIGEIAKKSHTDATLELKQLCCTFYEMRVKHIERARKECPKSVETYEELVISIIPNEINLICDDEEKLAKSCPKLEPIKISGTFKPQPGNSPSALALFIVATLGEPNDTPILT